MRDRLVYICSPYRGEMEKNIIKAQGYCREAAEHWPDVVPIAPHVYCTQFLNDTIQTERDLGMELGIAMLDMCDELWVYGIQNPSEGMKHEIAYAEANGIPVRDAAEVYRSRKAAAAEDDTGDELGDALIALPSHVGSFNGVAAIESTTVRISGEVITELAKQLRRNPGKDMAVEATT